MGEAGMRINRYEIIGKAAVESGAGHMQYALKLLYRGDGTPWWTCSSGLELPVGKPFFDSCEVGKMLSLTLSLDAAKSRP